MKVGLLIVSHSDKLAQGVLEMAAQMAPGVRLTAAGGADDGGLGTSLSKIDEGLADLRSGGAPVAVLTDLGSAVLSTETALEFLGSPDDVRLADAPLVEGAIAAAVAAEMGAELDRVIEAAEQAGNSGATNGAPPVRPGTGGRAFTAELTLVNPMGLHARPAAKLAAALGEMDTDVEINGVDGQSVMMLMTLGAEKGATLKVAARGPDARRAVDLIRTEVESGFGEV